VEESPAAEAENDAGSENDSGSEGDSGSENDSGTEDDAADGADTAHGDQFPVTIQHAFGETTIEEDPQRIATVGWTDQDMVVALGEVPVGSVLIGWGGNEDGSSDWFDEGVEE